MCCSNIYYLGLRGFLPIVSTWPNPLILFGIKQTDWPQNTGQKVDSLPPNMREEDNPLLMCSGKLDSPTLFEGPKK